MPSRRSYLGTLAGTGLASALSGCSVPFAPDYQVEIGAVGYHDATGQVITDGIHSRPDARHYACLCGDAAPHLIGPDAGEYARALREREREDGDRVFHLVVQARRPRTHPERVVPTDVALDGWRSVRVKTDAVAASDLSVTGERVVATGVRTIAPRGQRPPTTGTLVLPGGSTVPVENRWRTA